MEDQPVKIPDERRGNETATIAGDARYREAARVTIVGGILDLILGLAKLVAGYFAYSQALIADGIHSLSDVATDAIVLYAARHSNAGPDDEHPYGHGRFETIEGRNRTDVRPHITITGPKGKQILSKDLEYG